MVHVHPTAPAIRSEMRIPVDKIGNILRLYNSFFHVYIEHSFCSANPSTAIHIGHGLFTPIYCIAIAVAEKDKKRLE